MSGVVMVVAILATVCACSPQDDRSTGGAPAATAGATPTRLTDTRAAAFAAAQGIESPPPVAVVRTITPDEMPDVQASCMTDQGFPPNQDRGFDASVAQTEALNLALYRCTAMYPIDDTYLQPLSAEQQKVLYDYYVTTLVPCLTAQGFVIDPPPSLETFLATAGTKAEYQPGLSLPTSQSPEAARKLQATCPSSPPLDELYP